MTGSCCLQCLATKLDPRLPSRGTTQKYSTKLHNDRLVYNFGLCTTNGIVLQANASRGRPKQRAPYSYIGAIRNCIPGTYKVNNITAVAPQCSLLEQINWPTAS